jgi:hypothetical protein
MSQSSILDDVLSFTYWKKFLKREEHPGVFIPGQTCPDGCAVPRFSWLLCQLKIVLRVNTWLVYAPNVLVVIILTKSNQNYPSVSPTSGGGFWSHRAQEFWFPTLKAVLDPLQVSWSAYWDIIPFLSLSLCFPVTIGRINS